MRLPLNINIPADPRQIAVRVTDLFRDTNKQVNQLSEGVATAVTNAQTAVPSTGTYAQGDFVKNSAPTATDPLIGWLCVASGTPGTWTPSYTVEDYEEGTWTPTLTFGGGSTGITYSEQSGKYLKIGQLVFVKSRITLTSKGSSTGQALVTGLPFTAENFGGCVMHYYANMVGGPWAGYISSTQINPTVLSAITVGIPDHTAFNNNSDFIYVGHYMQA